LIDGSTTELKQLPSRHPAPVETTAQPHHQRQGGLRHASAMSKAPTLAADRPGVLEEHAAISGVRQRMREPGSAFKAEGRCIRRKSCRVQLDHRMMDVCLALVRPHARHKRVEFDFGKRQVERFASVAFRRWNRYRVDRSIRPKTRHGRSTVSPSAAAPRTRNE